LRAHRNLEFLVVIERLHHDVRAQRGLRKRNRHGLVKVATLSLKLVVLGNVDNHVQVARCAPLRAGFAFT